MHTVHACYCFSAAQFLHSGGTGHQHSVARVEHSAHTKPAGWRGGRSSLQACLSACWMRCTKSASAQARAELKQPRVPHSCAPACAAASAELQPAVRQHTRVHTAAATSAIQQPRLHCQKRVWHSRGVRLSSPARTERTSMMWMPAAAATQAARRANAGRPVTWPRTLHLRHVP